MPVGAIYRDNESAEFFDAATRGVLAAQRCHTCATWQFPQPFTPSTARCRHCNGTDLSWEPTSGSGTLVTWTQLHRTLGGASDAVTTVGIVELEEGPWVHTQIGGAVERGEGWQVGAQMQVAFESADDGEPVPFFLGVSDEATG